MALLPDGAVVRAALISAARNTARGETLPDGQGGLRILQKEEFSI